MARTRSPPPTFDELFVQQQDHRNRPAAPVGQVRIHEVEILVPGQHPQIELGNFLGEPCEHREQIDGVSAPVLAEGEQVPPPCNPSSL